MSRLEQIMNLSYSDFTFLGITSIWDLQKQSYVQYGTVKGSSVDHFFKTQEQMMGHYADFYETMNFQENQVESLEVGLKRVQDSYTKPKSKHI